MTPERTCVGCRRRAPQEELVRVVRLPDGSIAVGRHLHGRGAWLCRGSTDCVERAARRGALERALRGSLALGTRDDLVRQICRAGDVGGWKDTPAPREDA